MYNPQRRAPRKDYEMHNRITKKNWAKGLRTALKRTEIHPVARYISRKNGLIPPS